MCIRDRLICLEHMLQFNPTFRVDFISLAQMVKQLGIADFSQQIQLWNKKGPAINQQQQSEQEKIYCDLIQKTQTLEKENQQLQAQMWNSLTIEEKNKSMKEKKLISAIINLIIIANQLIFISF
eukprot:TRINITY_DN23608_c0_g1_i1.p2 TRINITY_DN23608_c0_g1~~TRINITY_DN23608_c0_g1_i1.p2  ORF type:complete len:134 (-),score=22.20 TRINITY_DN23608_c0_g1_i1:233-604(-)